VDNVWVMDWDLESGCKGMDLRPGARYVYLSLPWIEFAIYGLFSSFSVEFRSICITKLVVCSVL
jgi:hypothetical protein